MSLAVGQLTCPTLLSAVWTSIEKLQKDLSKEQNCRKNSATNDEPETSASTKEDILHKIEGIIEALVKSIKKREAPVLLVPNRHTWRNTSFDKNIGITMDTDCSQTKIRFEAVTSVNKFAMTVKLLSMIYQHVQKGTFATKRDIYYHHTELFGSQDYVDTIIDTISAMLSVPRWQLNVLATSKGLMAGDLQYTDYDGYHVNLLSSPQGMLIPNHIQGITNISSNAKFVLIVEKDASFAHLLGQQFLSTLGKCIVVTGKGVPDVNTRMLVKRLWDALALPTFALMDADPHGIEIMTIYKYGSLSMSFDNTNLALPNLKWLGLFPSDLTKLHISKSAWLPMKTADIQKAKDLLNRPYVAEHPAWKHELEVLLQTNVKAELESLNTVVPTYLPNVYIPQKLAVSGWL